jgi:hypothetical protein
MADYTKMMDQGTVAVIRRESDKAFIPVDKSNSDYKEYLEWLAEPNTPAEEDI